MNLLTTILTAGYHIKFTTDGYQQDGFVSSLLMVFLVISFYPCSMLAIIHASPNVSAMNAVSNVAYMGISIMIMVYILLNYRHDSGGWNDEHIPRATNRLSRVNQYFQDHLSIFGIVIFYIIGLIHDIGYFVIYIWRVYYTASTTVQIRTQFY